MANSSHVHQVGLVPSAVDPTIKSSTSAPVGSDPKERFLELERLTSSYLDDKDRALLEKAFRFAERCMLVKNVNQASICYPSCRSCHYFG